MPCPRCGVWYGGYEPPSGASISISNHGIRWFVAVCRPCAAEAEHLDATDDLVDWNTPHPHRYKQVELFRGSYSFWSGCWCRRAREDQVHL